MEKKRPERKYTNQQELKYRDWMGNILPKSAGKWPGLCRVCGKTISRANEMFKHRQTYSCQSSLRHRGLRHSNSGILVVTVVQNHPHTLTSQSQVHSIEVGANNDYYKYMSQHPKILKCNFFHPERRRARIGLRRRCCCWTRSLGRWWRAGEKRR